MKKTLICVVVVATISGCTINVGRGIGVGRIANVTQESLEKQFVPGVAKREDVVLQLGEPTDQSSAGGLEIWNYRYARRAAVQFLLLGVPVTATKVASFYFDDASGILKKIEYQVAQR